MSDFPMTDDEVLAYVDSEEEMSQELYETLFDFYTSDGAMPYGTAKARTGDPRRWIDAALERRAATIRFYTDTSHPSVAKLMEDRNA